MTDNTGKKSQEKQKEQKEINRLFQTKKSQTPINLEFGIFLFD